MKGIFIILLCVSLLGCADTKYLKRLDEIETAYKNGEISKAEYLHLKNETDNIRAPYDSRWSVSVGNKKDRNE